MGRWGILSRRCWLWFPSHLWREKDIKWPHMCPTFDRKVMFVIEFATVSKQNYKWTFKYGSSRCLLMFSDQVSTHLPLIGTTQLLLHVPWWPLILCVLHQQDTTFAAFNPLYTIPLTIEGTIQQIQRCSIVLKTWFVWGQNGTWLTVVTTKKGG